MNLFNANFNPIINRKRFFHLGIAAGLLTMSSCGQQGNSLGMKDKLVCVVPGMNCSVNHGGLNTLGESITSDDAHVEYVPVNWNAASMEDIFKQSADFINNKRRTGNYHQLFVGGHSLGGDVATHIATHGKLPKGARLFTINSPLAGILMPSQDELSKTLFRKIAGDYYVPLTPGSTFLNEVCNGFVDYNPYLLSIGSTCGLSSAAEGLLNGYEQFRDSMPLLRETFPDPAGLRENLLRTDGVVHIDSQTALASLGTNTAVVSYENRSHDTGLKFNGTPLTEAPCILAHADMHQILNIYIKDPDTALKMCRPQN